RWSVECASPCSRRARIFDRSTRCSCRTARNVCSPWRCPRLVRRGVAGSTGRLRSRLSCAQRRRSGARPCPSPDRSGCQSSSTCTSSRRLGDTFCTPRTRPVSSRVP
ncbi:hypothetical protein BE221DRAFT_64577, partial [Ostreococcus tauri]